MLGPSESIQTRPSESTTRPSESMVGPYHAHHRALPSAMSDRILYEDPTFLINYPIYRAPRHSDMEGTSESMGGSSESRDHGRDHREQ